MAGRLAPLTGRGRKSLVTLTTGLFLGAAALGICARGEYMRLDDFLTLVFERAEPERETIWFNGDQRATIKDMFGHEPGSLRQRYWGQGTRTAWVLEEIGKESPITVGIAVHGGRISRLEILAFRESRGWEVRYPFFTDQFIGQTLDERGQLSEPVDSITGATLSVRAVKKVARMALFLHRQTPYGDEPLTASQ